MHSKDNQHIILKRQGRELRLRKSLFWDLPENKPSADKNRRLIMERVFTRGTLNEFRGLEKFYTTAEIRNIVVKIGSLDPKTLNFIAKAYQIPLSDFKCCT
ncbi:MAG: hypothetical protein R6U78_03975 [Bacteroidales bacterium]